MGHMFLAWSSSSIIVVTFVNKMYTVVLSPWLDVNHLYLSVLEVSMPLWWQQTLHRLKLLNWSHQSSHQLQRCVFASGELPLHTLTHTTVPSGAHPTHCISSGTGYLGPLMTSLSICCGMERKALPFGNGLARLLQAGRWQRSPCLLRQNFA